MRNVDFGLSLEFASGAQTAVAINGNNVIFEVHKNELGNNLWFTVGNIDQATVEWSAAVFYDDGWAPDCAINSKNYVVEVHKSEGRAQLWYNLGRLSGTSLEWLDKDNYDSGVAPSVAINDQNVIVEIHQSDGIDRLFYHVGSIVDDSIEWGDSEEYDYGANPEVALNNSGRVVEVHESGTGGQLWYRVGQVNGELIDWADESYFYGGGSNPSVALTDDGFVTEVHTDEKELSQRVGVISGDKINWLSEEYIFDDGLRIRVGGNNRMVIQTHESEIDLTLWYSTSLITDRAKWMQDRLAVLGSKPLKQLVLPASHDAGMYDHGITETFAKTQDLNIYDQLCYGIRYFDLRPEWEDGTFYIHHDVVKGPKLAVVLDDLKRFMSEGHRELAILKFSHYWGFDDTVYLAMVQQITDSIGTWLYSALPPGKRLADVTLNEYVAGSGRFLVVCDENYPLVNPQAGIWVYRDWNSEKPEEGDLRVYDVYSNTIDYEDMKADQFQKFNGYNGMCEDDPNVPCDLFLLSWTLTPFTDVWLFSKTPNRNLGDAITELTIPNQYGCIVNMLYTDYVEYSRSTDVALYQNNAAL